MSAESNYYRSQITADFVILSRSKCSKSDNFAPICILFFTCADVEWLNERMHEKKLR